MIPRKIHQFWGGPEIPRQFQEWADTLRDMHVNQGFTYRLWTPDNVFPNEMYNRHLWEDAEYLSKEPWQFRADVLRYEILHRYGGIWVDMDFEPHRSLLPLIEPKDLMGQPTGAPSAFVAYEDEQWVSNAVMGSESYHPFIKAVIERIGRTGLNPSDANTVKTGPQAITPLAKAYQIHIYPSEFFYPFRFNELGTRGQVQGKYMTHHFWNRTKRLKDKGGF